MDDAALWTVGTAVLCAMLPQVCSLELSSSSGTVGADAVQQLPIQQTCMWKLILSCLEQGIHLSKKHSWLKRGTSEQGGNDVALSELLQRRGLYILRILVEQEQQPKNNSNNNVIADWNLYVACLETMEMENEPHLIAQVWDTVQDLAVAASSPRSDNGAQQAPPPLSWEWMHILWERVLLSPD